MAVTCHPVNIFLLLLMVKVRPKNLFFLFRQRWYFHFPMLAVNNKILRGSLGEDEPQEVLRGGQFLWRWCWCFPSLSSQRCSRTPNPKKLAQEILDPLAWTLFCRITFLALSDQSDWRTITSKPWTSRHHEVNKFNSWMKIVPTSRHSGKVFVCTEECIWLK